MSQVKWLRVTDVATEMPCVAVKLENDDMQSVILKQRAGWNPETEPVVVYWPFEHKCTYDAYHPVGLGRTANLAMRYIIRHFDVLKSGDEVDVRLAFPDETP